MLVVGKPHRRIHRHARNAFRLQQIGDLRHGKFADESLDRRIELIGMGAPINIIEPVRRIEHRRMIFPDTEKQFPMLPRHVKINEAVAALENFRRRHRAMLAAGALENLFFIGPQSNDMLLGR